MKRSGSGRHGPGWNRLQRIKRLQKKSFVLSFRAKRGISLQSKPNKREIPRRIARLGMTTLRLFPQPVEPVLRKREVGRAEGRPSEGTLPSAHREERASNISKLVSHVPPLRGFVPDANSVPPLPRWATLFRPCRDWPTEGCPPTDQFSERGPSR
jgi:hypothetical protein